MGQDSKIEWTTHTFNPWRGCTKVSDGCKFCYADKLSARNPKTLGVWGPNGTRVVAAESYWRQPLAWNSAAKAVGERHRVFCASLADVFEDWRGEMINSQGFQLWSRPSGWTCSDDYRDTVMLTMGDVRRRLFDLIDSTPNLDWLLLTKRPENVVEMLPNPRIGDKSIWRENIWLGTSVENQATADERIPHLLKCPAAVRFLSVEPLLGPVDLRNICHQTQHDGYESFGNFWDFNCENACEWRGFEDELIGDPGQSSVDAEENGTRWVCPKCHSDSALIERDPDDPGIDWVIVGGESGPHARPMHPQWARSIRDQCVSAGVPYFFKQWGQWAVEEDGETEDPPWSQRIAIREDGREVPLSYGRRDGVEYFGRVGKKGAGRLLDGREWNEFPKVAEAPCPT